MATLERDAMNCKDFNKELPDLLLTALSVPSAAAAAHLASCPPCTEEYRSFQQTFGLLDSWQPVEPTPFFDTRLQARVRELQSAPAMTWFERLQSRLLFNTGRNFRPALAGAFALALVAGGSGVVELTNHVQQPQLSATVNDLQILDRNDQAFKQMDELQQDDDSQQQTVQQAPQQDGTPIT